MILVTGATGFIGKHLILLLIQRFGKENIIALVSKPISECFYLLHNNYQFDNDFFVKNGRSDIEVIIHAGAFTPKKTSEANDIEMSFLNIENTKKLLNVKLPKIKKFIFLSTLDVYDNDLIISEDTLVKPITLYGTSKFYCEKMIEAWSQQFDVPIQILRIGHVYGPGEEAYQKIIPVTFYKILKNKSLQIWGSGNELRSFIYIKDLVIAISNCVFLEENIGVINLVGGQSISINSLVKKIIEITKNKVVIEKIQSEKAERNLVFDNSKMMNFLLDKETILDEGLREEFEYIKNKICYL